MLKFARSHPYHRGPRRQLLCATIACCLMVACAADTRRRVMHFFFEYPDAPSVDSSKPAEPGLTTSANRSADDRRRSLRVMSQHPPFTMRQCESCHAPELGQRLHDDFPSLCRDCHETHFEERRYVHGPVASGDCLFCHTMHVSTEKALLTQPQAVLCTSCHPAQWDDGAPAPYHDGIERLACTDCHEAHFADNPKLMKPDRVRLGSMLQSLSDDNGSGKPSDPP